MLAVRSEHSALVDLLCKRGANRHVLGFDNIDPIDYAINKRNQYLSDVLLKHERTLSASVDCFSSSLNESKSVLDELKSDSSIQHEEQDRSNNIYSNCSVFQSD